MTTTTTGIEHLAVDLLAAQNELRNPPKDKRNPHFNSWYSDLATVRETLIPVLTRHGLAVVQLLTSIDGKPALQTMLLHKSGQHISGTVPLMLPKGNMQDLGSAVTYARRYGLLAITGTVGDDDDDGNAASQPVAPKAQNAGPSKADFEAAMVAVGLDWPSVGARFAKKGVQPKTPGVFSWASFAPEHLTSFYRWMQQQQGKESGN